MTAKINVRQPLQALKVKIKELSENEDCSVRKAHGLSGFKIHDKTQRAQLVELVKDEVNVKSVTFGAPIETDVHLDITMTPELKEEGMVRELIRAIQDLRKEKGLSVNDMAILTAETSSEGQAFIEKNKAQLSAACSIKEMKFDSVVGEVVVIGEFVLKLRAER
jgi:isoleucyl-tRNA synthetase